MKAAQAIATLSMARFPSEACGFVFVTGAIVEAENAAEDPLHGFRISDEDAERWWRTGGIVGVWHSHCFDPAVPSAQDEAQAVPGLQCWIYSVLDGDLGIYMPDPEGRLQLVEMTTLGGPHEVT